MSDFSSLLSPLLIQSSDGQLTVRNRVLVSAHVPGFAVNNKPGQQYIDYHRQFAAGGVGLQLTGGTPIHESGLLSSASDGLWNLDDSIIPGYEILGKAVHDEGGRILAQLAHSGGTVLIDQPGRVSWAASAVRSDATGRVPHKMSVPEIIEVVAAYAAAASRVRQGGLDGVELLAAFGFLPQGFLSPLSNTRQDEYGGKLENRMRFLVEVLKAIREQLGANQILGVRLPGDEFEPGGLDLTQMIEICQILASLGLVDYLNIIAHTNFSHTGRSKHWAPTPAPHGVFIDLAATIRQAVNVPVFAVGRVTDPRHADKIIADGKADMVGMTRAHICDPQIVTKIMQRQQATIRPCVGANTCIANRYAGKTIRCMHNPMLKSPGQKLVSTAQPKKIAIIGAGPAGLEVARLCASRGHEVTVYEASGRVGGQLAVWAKSSSMAELGKIVRWRIDELVRLGVETKLNQTITQENLASLAVSDVIVATGAIDRKSAFFKTGTTAVMSPTGVLKLDNTTVRRALVCNDGRGQAGLVAAEWLLSLGVEVEIVTADMAVAADLDPTNRNAWYERLGKAGVVMTAQTELHELTQHACVLRNVFSDRLSHRERIDLVVDWNGCDVVDHLLEARPNSNNVKWHAIGDCLAPRNVEVAMAEAFEVSIQI